MTSLTPYPEVNVILADLHTDVQRILGDNFVGMYLYGSLTTDDFAPDSSDIDFLVALHEEVRGKELEPLVQMHADRFEGATHPLERQLEGAYISTDALRRHDPANATHPHIDRGEGVLSLKTLNRDWVIQRYVLRNRGIALSGPPITNLIDPINPMELREAVQELMDIWWEPMSLHPNPPQLQHGGYRSYAVLSMCRILYTWENGAVVSKSEAAAWAVTHLDKSWKQLIERANQNRNGTDLVTVEQVCDFIQFTAHRMRASL
jgi:hypothetical protein